MTEEIIIDGVDVAGCISFDKNNGHNICCYDDTREDKIPFANFCVENKNCYYKQFKRLEQENKELKKQIESNKGLITVCGKQQYEKTMAYDKCKTALEEIRNDMEQDTTCESRECGCDDYAECLNCLKETIINKINEVLGEV